MRFWTDDVRKKFGYKDSSNWNARLACYFAVKCGAFSVAELNTMGTRKMIAEGRKEYNNKYPTDKPGYYAACLDLCRN